MLQTSVSSRLSDLTFYRKDNSVFVFDQIGNCFRISNSLDEFEREDSETIVDKENIRSPLPGIVGKIEVQKGQKIKKVKKKLIKGKAVCYLEAMKMEHKVVAPADIEIIDVLVKEKSFVEAGQPLFKIK